MMNPKHRITILIFLLSICFISDIIAQVGYEDVVYLKNGSIIHGMIIEQVPNQSIKIKTKDSNIFFYKMDDIEKLTKEYTGSKKHYVEASEIKGHPYSGFSFGVAVSIGNGIGNTNNEQAVIAAHALLGYMHNSVFWGGASLGLNSWHTTTYNSQYSSMDFNIAIRVFPLRKRITPLLVADAGYSMQTDNTGYSGGLTFNIGAGGRINLTQKRAISICICYKAQQGHQTDYVNNYPNNFNNPNSNEPFYLEAICFETGFFF